MSVYVWRDWSDVADTLAAAMEHSEGGVCTLTDAEHAALAVYMDARRDHRTFTRTTLGFAGRLGAFVHRHRRAGVR